MYAAIVPFCGPLPAGRQKGEHGCKCLLLLLFSITVNRAPSNHWTQNDSEVTNCGTPHRTVPTQLPSILHEPANLQADPSLPGPCPRSGLSDDAVAFRVHRWGGRFQALEASQTLHRSHDLKSTKTHQESDQERGSTRTVDRSSSQKSRRVAITHQVVTPGALPPATRQPQDSPVR